MIVDRAKRICADCGKGEDETHFRNDLRYKRCENCLKKRRLASGLLPPRTCLACGKSELEIRFPEARRYRTCNSCSSRRITQINRGSRRYKGYMLGYNLQRNYGITVEQYNVLVEAQEMVCIICGRPPEGYRLRVDHDHLTGKIRGLTCNSCNSGMGRFRDDPELLEKAARYIRTHREETL